MRIIYYLKIFGELTKGKWKDRTTNKRQFEKSLVLHHYCVDIKKRVRKEKKRKLINWVVRIKSL